MGFGSLGIWEILIIAVIVLVFFGPNRLPEIARSTGRALREFRRGMNEIQRELEGASDAAGPSTRGRRRRPPEPTGVSPRPPSEGTPRAPGEGNGRDAASGEGDGPDAASGEDGGAADAPLDQRDLFPGDGPDAGRGEA